jgi:hypothetical protein
LQKIDALSERLREPRTRRVVEPILTGELNSNLGRSNPDVMLAMDLGLVKWTSETGLTISNPIYTDILKHRIQRTMAHYRNQTDTLFRLPAGSQERRVRTNQRLPRYSCSRRSRLFDHFQPTPKNKGKNMGRANIVGTGRRCDSAWVLILGCNF